MNIGIVCNKFGSSGGMERYTLDMVRAFYRLTGRRVTVISRSFDTGIEEYAWITPVKIATTFLPSRLRDFYMDWRLKGMKERYGIDVLIGNCRTTVADIVCCGGTHKGFVQNTGKAVSSYDRRIQAFEDKEFACAKSVIAHSGFIRDEIVNLYGTDPAKVTVLYPPTQFDFEKAERSAKAPKPFTLDSGSVNFLFVSSSHQRKGFDLLEPFFESTDLPVKLYVAGRDLPKGRNYRNIEYLGYFEDIYSVYPHFDYSVLASSYEPFGLAPVESLVCGTPVVIAENLGCSEIIPEDLKITFKRTEKSLEEAVRQAVRERDARKRSAAENKDRIRALFNTGDAHFGEILRIAEKLAGER